MSANRSGGMTWEQIGRAIGCTPQGAQFIFERALRKLLRQCPNSLLFLSMLSDALDDERRVAERTF